MRYSVLLATSALLGLASAKVYTAKLQKVSLSEQLENANIGDHVKALGQKYMGVRAEKHIEEMFRDTRFREDKGHDHSVPITNFLNAQCMSHDAFHRFYTSRIYSYSHRLL